MRKLWRPVELEFARRITQNDVAEAYLRIYFLALTRNRGDGHAHFDRGELSRLLGVDRRNLAGVITAAAKRGLVRSDSNSQCLWLPRGHDHRASGKELTDHYPCQHHKPRRRHAPSMTKAALRHAESMTFAATRHAPNMTLSDVSAGQGVAPHSSTTGPTQEPSPAVSVSTRGRLLLTAGRPPVPCTRTRPLLAVAS